MIIQFTPKWRSCQDSEWNICTWRWNIPFGNDTYHSFPYYQRKSIIISYRAEYACLSVLFWAGPGKEHASQIMVTGHQMTLWLHHRKPHLNIIKYFFEPSIICTLVSLPTCNYSTANVTPRHSQMQNSNGYIYLQSVYYQLYGLFRTTICHIHDTIINSMFTFIFSLSRFIVVEFIASHEPGDLVHC